MIKSPLRYPGGKSKAIPTIVKYLPQKFSEYSEYREPFVGGGSLFIYLKQKYPQLKVWINDLNQELFLFWKIAQSHLAELVTEARQIKANYTNGRDLFIELTLNAATFLFSIRLLSEYGSGNLLDTQLSREDY